MPRCYNDGPMVDSWYHNPLRNRHGSGSSTWDLCLPCFQKYEGKTTQHFDRYNGDPIGLLQGGMEHPPIDDMITDGYTCEKCGVKLNRGNY